MLFLHPKCDFKRLVFYDDPFIIRRSYLDLNETFQYFWNPWQYFLAFRIERNDFHILPAFRDIMFFTCAPADPCRVRSGWSSWLFGAWLYLPTASALQGPHVRGQLASLTSIHTVAVKVALSTLCQIKVFILGKKNVLILFLKENNASSSHHWFFWSLITLSSCIIIGL